MGCGSALKKGVKDILKAKASPVTGDFSVVGGKEDTYGIKKGWDDMSGATARKAAEDAAEQAEAARKLSETYQRGAKSSPKKTQKTGAGRGARGTRLVRQPLGTYKTS